MKRLLMVVLVGLVVSGPAWGRSSAGMYGMFNVPQCGEYSDAYAKTTLKSDGGYKGPYEAWQVFGWINGYVTAYNQHTDNEIVDILGTLTTNDIRRWIASWCRDNPTQDVLKALAELISKQ